MSFKLAWLISAVWMSMAARCASGYPYFGHRWIESAFCAAIATFFAWVGHRARRETDDDV